MKLFMSPRDSLTLAVTKLRVRRVRLTITLAVMSILFASLFFGSILVAGAAHSAREFGKEGLGGRYIVAAQPNSYLVYNNQSLLSSVQGAQAGLTAQKVAFAKKYSLAYDPKTDTSLPLISQQTGPSPTDTAQQPNTNSPIVAAALLQQNNQMPISYSAFQKLAVKSGAKATYRSTGQNFGSSPTDIKVLVDGKEDINDKPASYGGAPTGLQSITTLGWNQMSDSLLQPFLLPGQTTTVGADGSIPITAPYSAATEILGLPKLPDGATVQQKLSRLEQVRRGVAGKQTTICYRNAASVDLLQKAVVQQQEIVANKNKQGYTLPDLQYSLPMTACGPVTIKKDARSVDEKLADLHQQQLDAITMMQQDPVQGLFNVRIVGITADVNYGSNSSLSAGNILSSILSSNLGQGWLSPVSAFHDPASLVTQAQGGTADSKPISSQNYYAEFGSLAAAKQFITDQTCDQSTSSGMYDPNALVTKCSAQRKYFSVAPFGNNAGAIADFQHHVWKYARFVLGVMVIAVFVMIGTLGKIIADSRRETAVFRALGARRMHISQIYLTYALLLGIMIIGLSFIVSCIGAGVINQRLEPGLSSGAVIAYNARNVHEQFSVFTFDWRYVGVIMVIILVTSLAATVLPLLLNMRRNPIRDMREE